MTSSSLLMSMPNTAGNDLGTSPTLSILESHNLATGISSNAHSASSPSVGNDSSSFTNASIANPSTTNAEKPPQTTIPTLHRPASSIVDALRPVVKIRFGDRIKRITLPKSEMASLTMTELTALSKKHLSLPHDEEFIFKFKDTEGDWVLLEDDVDLSNAIALGPILNVQLSKRTASSSSFNNVFEAVETLKPQLEPMLTAFKDLLVLLDKQKGMPCADSSAHPSMLQAKAGEQLSGPQSQPSKPQSAGEPLHGLPSNFPAPSSRGPPQHPNAPAQGSSFPPSTSQPPFQPSSGQHASFPSMPQQQQKPPTTSFPYPTPPTQPGSSTSVPGSPFPAVSLQGPPHPQINPPSAGFQPPKPGAPSPSAQPSHFQPPPPQFGNPQMMSSQPPNFPSHTMPNPQSTPMQMPPMPGSSGSGLHLPPPHQGQGPFKSPVPPFLQQPGSAPTHQGASQQHPMMPHGSQAPPPPPPNGNYPNYPFPNPNQSQSSMFPLSNK